MAAGNTVLVIGGAGYVGQFVVQELLKGPHCVHVAHRRGRDVSRLPEAVICHPLDCADSSNCGEVLRAVKPHVVVNCAAISALGACEKDPAAAEAANCPRDLVRAIGSEAKGALFVHFSTDIVFGGSAEHVYSDDAELGPVNTYGRLKADFEAFLAETTEPRCVALRASNILGPVQPYMNTGTKFLQWLDNQLRDDSSARLFEDEIRNYVWVEDIAAVIAKLAGDFPDRLPKYRTFNCGGPAALSRVDVAHALVDAKRYSPSFTDSGGVERQRVVPIPRADIDLGYAAPLCVRLDSRRLEAYLERPLRSVKECLAENAARL
uniref:RmlD-like substrate binding domain-containing protein n=1 Tax=Zooxanthella nutricula TaxID=1333877 RepID=A0A6U6IDF6_9DINO|mmetsp:Transcript_18222/g.54481  ORF Transcript_18222/g.54481 Transcript_18222/m.54481 type:complete len:321 (+) Transcript_18222:55-1017(+)